MDELLKAYADKRRQESGAPMELHPATRHLLQGEVARTYGGPRRQSWLAGLLTYWPRVAFAVGCLAITFTLMLLILPRRAAEQMELAATTSRDAPAEEFNNGVQDKERSLRLNEAAEAPAATPSITPETSLADLKRTDKLVKNSEREALKPAGQAGLVTREKKEADEVKLMFEQAGKETQVRAENANQFANQRFYWQRKQGVYLGAKVETQPQILDFFQYEQMGENIQITDQDGSVYAGRILSEQELRKQVPDDFTAAQGAAGPAAWAYPVQFFRATGTNRSLRQLVSIEANIVQTNIVQTNTLPSRNAPISANGRLPAQQPQSQIQQLIRGRATIGRTQELNIEAVPAPQQQQP